MDTNTMKKLSFIFTSLALLVCSTALFAGIADPQTYIKSRDFTVVNSIGIPASVGWVEVQNLGVEFPPHNASSTTNRHKPLSNFYGAQEPAWHDVTFVVHAKKGDEIEELFESFSKGDNIRGSISVNIMNPKETYQTIASFELQELTLIRFSKGLVADVEHPSTLKFSFTVSPGYVKISTFKDNINSKTINSVSKLVSALQMPKMKSFSYSGIEMQKNDTTIAGDQYGTDTCHVDNYGTISMEFKLELDSVDWINIVRNQYEGSIGGAKPNGGFEVSGGLSWHVESFNFPTFNSKSDAQLIQYVTIRIEKFIKK